MRIGIITDLHLGHAGEGRWHNRLLFDHAETIVTRAVAALNGAGLKLAVVLGDLTHRSRPEDLALARGILDGLTLPWAVLPGNHEWPGRRAGAFDDVFADRLLRYQRFGDLAVAGLPDRTPDPDSRDYYHPDPKALERLHAELDADPPRTLVLCTHMPLYSGAAWADAHGGKDALSYTGGEELAAALAARVPRLILCSGHQHWHHVARVPGGAQITTAALIEYPMEARLLTLDPDRIAYDLLPIAPELAARSLDADAWVAGREEDRQGSL